MVLNEEVPSALDSPDSHLLGVALDVTDPEPLPDHHLLFSHPRVIITPHMSGFTVGDHWDRVVDVFLKNVDKWEKGEEFLTVVNREKGY